MVNEKTILLHCFGSCFLRGVKPWSAWLTLPGLTEAVVPLSSQLVAAAEFKGRSHVQNYNSQRP